MKKKEEIFISHVLFPWETFAAQGEREERERNNGGIRWTEEFLAEIRENVLRYADITDKAVRNSNLNDTYWLVPHHFRDEIFAGVSFPIWDRR